LADEGFLVLVVVVVAEEQVARPEVHLNFRLRAAGVAPV
jgi:hypothetical protein